MSPLSSRLLVAIVAAFSLAFGVQPRAASRAYGITGHVIAYTVAGGDTLAAIGARSGVDPATLAAANALRPNARLTPGQTLQIDNRHIVPPQLDTGLIVVNVPQRMLFYDDGASVTAFPVAVGRSTWRTPLGAFHVVKREENPSWEVPVSIQAEAQRAGKTLPAVVPPGPDNPLGKFWLGLSFGGVGIHGTNAPSSIYRVTTHGCIRAHPDDIAQLFPRVGLETAGVVVYERVLLASAGREVFLEAHRDVYGREPDGRAEVQRLAEAIGVANRLDWAAVDAVLAGREGVARMVTRKNPQPSTTVSH